MGLLSLPGAATDSGTDTIKTNRNARFLTFQMYPDLVATIVLNGFSWSSNERYDMCLSDLENVTGAGTLARSTGSLVRFGF